MELKKKILIVEDDKISAKHIKLTLEARGYVVAGSVVTGGDAINMTAELRPDLILMDVNIKGDIDGIETAAKIKEEFDVPVIFLTAYSDTKTINKMKKVAPYGYILKPFRERELIVVIEMVFTKYEYEQKLAISEERFRKLVNSSPVGIASINGEGIIKEINPEHSRILGLEYSEIIDKINVHEFSPLAENGISKDIKKCHESNEAHVAEYIYISQSGRSTELFCHITPIYDDEGNVDTVLLISQDVSEIREVERELYLNEEKLAMALVDSNLGIVEWDVKSGDAHFDNRFIDMLEYNINELERNIDVWKNLIHPEDREATFNLLQEHLVGNTEKFVSKYRLKKKTGQWQLIFARGRVIQRNEKKDALYMLITHLNVTEFKNLEVESMDARQSFKSLFNAITQPSIIWRIEDDEIYMDNFNTAILKDSIGEIANYIDIEASVFFEKDQDILENIRNCMNDKENIRQAKQYICRFNEDKKFEIINYIYLSQNYILLFFE
ncbi:response regulator [Spirochaetota bacterium]